MAATEARELIETEEESASRSCVVLVRCDSYDEATVDRAVERGLALLGGPRQFVKRGEQILLKPNLLVGSAPDQAVTTHPAVFGAVARQLQAAGANLTYGDSPGVVLRPGRAEKPGAMIDLFKPPLVNKEGFFAPGA